MKVRTHQHQAKHFIIADHSKEKESQEPGKTCEFNSNENDDAGTEINTSGGENISEDELDLRLELEEEELQDEVQ